MFRRLITDRHRGNRHRCRRPGAGRQSAGRARHDRGQDPHRALPRRRAEDRRELPRLRQGQALRRHAVPPRDRRLHDPGRRLHRRLQAEADAAAGRERGRAEQQGRACSTCPGTIAMARTGDPNSATAQFFINVNDNKSLNFRERRRRATATRCSARWSRAWTWSTRSPTDADRRRRTVPEGRAGRARDHQQRDRRRRQVGMHHGHPAHQPRRHHARARRGERAEKRRQLPGSTCAPDTSTTRCSIA